MKSNTQNIIQPHFIIKPVDESSEIVGIAELAGHERDSRPLHLDDFRDCLTGSGDGRSAVKGELPFCVVAKTNRHFDYQRFCSLNSVKNNKKSKKSKTGEGTPARTSRYIISDYFCPDTVIGYVVCKARKRKSVISSRNKEYVSVLSFVVHPKFRQLGLAGDMFDCLLSIIPPHLPIHVSVPVECIEACLLLRSLDFPPPQETDLPLVGHDTSIIDGRRSYYMFTYNRKLVEL